MNNRIYLTENDSRTLNALLEEAFAVNRENKKVLEGLRSELQRAEIVKPGSIKPDVVTMNSKVSVRDLETQEEMVYQLVFPKEANIMENKISIFAPVGTAIIGCKVGDVVEWPVPRGVRKLKIEQVLYQPEAAGKINLG